MNQQKNISFEYYKDENENIYITREGLELGKSLNIELNLDPEIINNKNYYKISKKELEEIEKKVNIKEEKKKNEIIIYKDKNTNKLYIPEVYNYCKKKQIKKVMNKNCYETTEKELEKIYNKKFIIVTVYLSENTKKIIVCNYNNILYIKEAILNKYLILPNKKIKVDGEIYIEVNEEIIKFLKQKIEEEEKIIITFKMKEIIPLNIAKNNSLRR